MRDCGLVMGFAIYLVSKRFRFSILSFEGEVS